jgi:hypothetical protein
MISKHDGSNLFQARQTSGNIPQEMDPSLKRLADMQSEVFDNLLWATTQGLALAKLKVFHSMAKQVNDQQ